MRHAVALVTVALLSGCTTSPQPGPQASPGTLSPTLSVATRKLQNRWGKCLTSSYGITVKQTPNKNAAAEMAFQACSTEEQALASFVAVSIGQPWASDTMANLKAGMKHMLVEDGRVPESPEQ
jgi:hypothetical protein